ncbi:insulin receptor substrate 1, partial [Caerostris extrusa]
MGPINRPRSASNSENSRPIATRRPVAIVTPQSSYGSVRDRCDSMPSRPRTISEGQEVNN